MPLPSVQEPPNLVVRSSMPKHGPLDRTLGFDRTLAIDGLGHDIADRLRVARDAAERE